MLLVINMQAAGHYPPKKKQPPKKAEFFLHLANMWNFLKRKQTHFWRQLRIGRLVKQAH